MDFKDLDKFKKKALDFKDKATKTVKETTKTVITNSAKKLSKSGFVIDAENSTILEETQKIISDNKKIWIIFWEESQSFYEKLLVYLPVIWTKSFSKNFTIKIVNVEKWDEVCKKYSLEKLPSMIFFSWGNAEKTFSWEEEIIEMVKKLSLEIEK